MTIHEMIALLEGAKEGKPIQKRIIIGMAGGSEPTWECMCNNHFNFHAYEYRLKPVPREFWAWPDKNCLVSCETNCRPTEDWVKVREVLE